MFQKLALYMRNMQSGSWLHLHNQLMKEKACQKFIKKKRILVGRFNGSVPLTERLRTGHKTTSTTATETRDATADDPEALHKKKMIRNWGRIADTFRAIVVLAVSFAMAGNSIDQIAGHFLNHGLVCIRLRGRQ